MSKDFVRTLGFIDNKKCSGCNNMAWYKIGQYYFCDLHMSVLNKKLGEEFAR